MRDVKSRPRKLNAKGLIAGSLSLRIDPHRKVDAESMRVIADRNIPDDEDDRGTDGSNTCQLNSGILAPASAARIGYSHNLHRSIINRIHIDNNVVCLLLSDRKVRIVAIDS